MNEADREVLKMNNFDMAVEAIAQGFSLYALSERTSNKKVKDEMDNASILLRGIARRLTGDRYDEAMDVVKGDEVAQKLADLLYDEQEGDDE